jgi:hypothetical protein
MIHEQIMTSKEQKFSAYEQITTKEIKIWATKQIKTTHGTDI